MDEVWPVQPDFEANTIAGSRGLPLYIRKRRTSAAPLAEVIFTHGLGEHSGRYPMLTEALAHAGLRFWGYDLHGHGRSGGNQGDVPEYNVFTEDLEKVVAWVEAQTDRPLLLMGHSLGGQITANYLSETERSFRGAVLTSPWLRLAFRPPLFRMALAHLSYRLAPGYVQSSRPRQEKLSRDLAFLDSLPEPELMHRKISARLYFEVVRAGERALANAGKLTLPLLLVHGSGDEVTSMPATREFYEAVSSRDKELNIYPDARHETHNDLCRDQARADVVQWLRAHAEHLQSDGNAIPATTAAASSPT